MEPRISLDFYHADGFWTAPVALISTGVEKPNIFTLGVMGGPSDNPPMITISPRAHRYSYELLQKHQQFVVNFPTVDMVDEMELCGTKSGRYVDKWTVCGFTPIKGKVVDVPLIAECPVNLECVVHQEIEFQREDGRKGSHLLTIGRIVQIHCHERYYIDGALQWDLVELIYRARPKTWRALGAVIGYDSRFEPPTDPRLDPQKINERAAELTKLFKS